VPREKEHLPGNVFFQQKRRINDQKTFAKRQEGKQAPSEMLEQVLTAVVLRKAKERICVRNNPVLKPAYDDEESERLVKPAVRDVIARLDTLLRGCTRRGNIMSTAHSECGGRRLEEEVEPR
jgi:hypothetical protein